MKKELEKNYNHQSVENQTYEKWLSKNYFHAEVDKSKKPYTIVIPPPNITGQLHIGHALNATMQDILIRTKRMQGYNAMWLPGTDHASISTEMKIVQAMAEEGVTKADIGRDAFLERAWAWREEYGRIILKQFHKLGCSCDWERERFTMDEGLSAAVLEVFIRMYKKGYIYRGEKLVNWCPNCKTSISDAEVDHLESQGGFWYFKYPIDGTDEFISFATTRPETMLADTAIAVNPDDEKYKKYIGKTVTVPIINRVIPIIADSYVEQDFGTGAVKITPAHDPNDADVGARHNLPIINIMNDDGSLNENAGDYCGLDRYDARKRIIEEFTKLGLFVKSETVNNSVGTHEKCNTVIEPLVKLQWFVKMSELAGPALDVYKDKTLNIVPERFGKIYTHWLENIKDWCISRQLWWGHRIPAYYCADCNHVTVAKDKVELCEKCQSKNIKQDEDTLDTWFSSALWPFSTLGWPDKTDELDYFFPTNVLVTAHDILFFWVVRMVFSSLEYMDEVPFPDVLFHGLIRDSQGRKMSKSLGNGIDPLDVIENFGADALRLTLISGNSPGNDLRFYQERLDANRNFLNKIWNAARFMLMNFKTEEDEAADISKENLTDVDKWIISRVNTVAKEVLNCIDSYELGMAVQKVYDFIWDEYCDWYIEMVKPRLYNESDSTRRAALATLKMVFINAMKLLHPFMPFITEEIFTSIQDDEETIMLSKWHEFDESLNFKKEEQNIELIKDAVKSIRQVRLSLNVPPAKKVNITVVADNDQIAKLFEDSKAFFASLAGASDVLVQQDRNGINDDAVSTVIKGATLYIPFGELVDVEKEMDRLEKEKERLSSEIERINKKLLNEGFIAKAKESVVNGEKEKLVGYEEMLRKIEGEISKLKGMK
ncbi:MAG: valine--tRNA ligase [Defluviitaleaceae bacterium]|nr:valine--tRNA ligase [Defluviitaleaceae bacterium]